MSVIERRWTIYACGRESCDYAAAPGGGCCGRCGKALNRVEVVPAEQLEGAVEALDEMRAVLANLREVAINGGAMEAGGGYDVTVLRPLLGGQ